MSVSTFFKKINIVQIISLVGFVGAIVVLILLTVRDNAGDVNNVAVADEYSVEQEIAGVQSVMVVDYINSLPLNGVEDFNGAEFTYTEHELGFAIKDSRPLQSISEADFQLPFYWQDLYQGDEFSTGVEMFVVNKPFHDFVSGIRYGLTESFVNEHDVQGVQRTTGFQNSFVHQAYIDLENGTTLVLELREETDVYPGVILDYIAGFKLL